MGQARVKFGETELPLESGVTSVGRTPDNDVSFPHDPNVSRFHAEIEMRAHGEYWLTDTGSSNGTTVNGKPVRGDVPLSNGDVIVLGGSSELTFLIGDETKQASAAAVPESGPVFETPHLPAAE